MNDTPIHDNGTLGERILQLKSAAASQATQMFRESHPDWLLRHGASAWQPGVEQAQHHIESLAGAVEANSPAAFEDYCAWAGEFLECRAIAIFFLVEHLRQIETSLCSQLSQEDQVIVAQFMEAGRRACAPGRTPSGIPHSSVLQSGSSASNPIRERG